MTNASFGDGIQATLKANMSAADRDREAAAALSSDQAAEHRDRAIEHARAVQYRTGTAEMAQLDAADHHYQHARRHLESLWDAATATPDTE